MASLKPINLVERLLHTLTNWTLWKVPQSDDLPEDFHWDTFATRPIEDGAVAYEIFTDPIYDGAKDITLGWGNSRFKPHKGSLGGTPYEVVTKDTPHEKVLLTDKHHGLSEVRMPVTREPWVQNYPNPHGDMHYLVVDIDNGLIYETISFRPSLMPDYKWACSSFMVWDITKTFEEQASPSNGVCAAKVPYFPLITRYQEVASGKVEHAAGISVSNYLQGAVPPAQNYDGEGFEYKEPPVPVFAGTRLRLKEEYYEKMLREGGACAVHAEQLRTYGGFITDKTGVHHGSIWGAPDARWKKTNINKFKPTINDFEIVA